MKATLTHLGPSPEVGTGFGSSKVKGKTISQDGHPITMNEGDASICVSLKVPNNGYCGIPP